MGSLLARPHKINRALENSLNHLASFGDIAYTERQLYYEVCRQMRTVPGIDTKQVPNALFLSTVFGLLFLKRPKLAASLITLGALTIQGLRLIRKLPFTLPPPITFPEFETRWHHFSARYGQPKNVLLPMPHTPTPISPTEPDLHDYGLSQAIVCQQPAVAQMLLANHVHMTLSCPILSLTEASPIPSPIQAMLDRTATPTIYFLHDASVAGLTAINDLRDQLAIPDTVRIMAMGLRPVQAQRLHLFGQYDSQMEAPLTNSMTPLSNTERQWLETGWYSETEALHPVRLMRALRRIILGNPHSTDRLDFYQEKMVGFLTWPTDG